IYIPLRFTTQGYLPFFDTFEKAFTPWAPDSTSFVYVTNEGAYVQEVRAQSWPPVTDP
ncbi:unnamed protein product, partial [Discosporangium mesarthrocarpum]